MDGGAPRRPSTYELEAPLCELHRALAALRPAEHPREARAGGAPNLEHLDASAARLEALRGLQWNLAALLAGVSAAEAAVAAEHAAACRALEAYFAAAGRPPPRQHSAEVRGAAARVGFQVPPDAPPQGRPPGPPGELGAPGPPGELSAPPAPWAVSGGPLRRSIELAPQVSLEAVLVPEHLVEPREILEAVRTPELYYIQRWDHFAVRVGGTVLHGNLGDVSSGPGILPRARECRKGARCPRGAGYPPCAHYHDPALVAGSRDVRNHYAAGRRRGRALGLGPPGLGSLGADLLAMSAVEARARLDRAAHELLFGLLAAKYAA